MKFSYVVLSLLPASAALAASVDITDIRAAFVPNGFDSNDEVTLVIDGYLPDPCHKLRAPKIEEVSNKVKVVAQAEVVAGSCTDMIVPFTQVVRVGTMNAGAYAVEVSGLSTPEALQVATASRPGQDDYLYAAVDSVHLTADKSAAVLRGRFSDSCQSIDDVKVIPTGKTIQILPILKLTGTACKRGDREFERVVPLPKENPGKYLLHVRSLNGQAVNALFSVGS